MRAGADLKEARLRLGLTLPDVASAIRIRLPHLEALEEGQISLLPGNAYALAFVRTYATTLGLDAEEMVSLAEQALPPPVASSNTTEPAAPRIIVADKPSAETLANPAPPVAAISPSSAAAAQMPPRIPDAAIPLVPAVPVVPEQGRMMLRANADSWLMVKDRAGIVLLNRVLKAGETWPVPVRTDLLLTTGNAGGTDIVVDGAMTASIGGSGAVRRDLPLDPDQIKDGKLAVAAISPVAAVRPRQ